jgi:integrase
MDIREVNGQRIKAYATWRMEQPGSTWNNVHRDVARIGRMLRWAASNDWIPAVPVTKHIYKMAPPGQTACKPHEVADIVRVMDTVSEASRDYHEFVMATGLRHGEMARLTMANITPSVGTPGIAAVIRLTEAKTNSRERGIGLDQWTYDIAKKYAPEDPSKPIWGTTRYRGFARHAKRLLGRTITPRDLRSWFITRMAERDLTAAMLAAGHKNPRTTARYMKNPEAQTAAACSAVHEHMAHIRKRTPIAGTASQKLHISKEL